MSNFALAVVFGLPFCEPDLSLADLSRFPPPGAVEAATRFARARYDWLAATVDAQPWQWRRDARCDECREAFDLWRVWDALRFAQDDARPPGQRLYWLRDLRKRLGPEDYARGLLPPAAPEGRFRHID